MIHSYQFPLSAVRVGRFGRSGSHRRKKRGHGTFPLTVGNKYLQFDGLDLSHEPRRGVAEEYQNDCKNSVAEAADIQDVGSLRCVDFSANKF